MKLIEYVMIITLKNLFKKLNSSPYYGQSGSGNLLANLTKTSIASIESISPGHSPFLKLFSIILQSRPLEYRMFGPRRFGGVLSLFAFSQKLLRGYFRLG